jgi:hypothetical protein
MKVRTASHDQPVPVDAYGRPGAKAARSRGQPLDVIGPPQGLRHGRHHPRGEPLAQGLQVLVEVLFAAVDAKRLAVPPEEFQ